MKNIDDEKAKRYFQLQNRNLAFKEQLNTRTRPEEIISTAPDLTSRTQDSSTATTSPKRKRRRIQFVNYLDDPKAHGKQLWKRRHKKFQHYKNSMGEEDED